MMDVRIILLIIMGVSLISWVIYSFYKYQREVKERLSGMGLIGQISCETCGNTYELAGKELFKTGFVKSKKVARKKVKPGYLIKEAEYSSYAKRIFCPQCKKKTYGKVLNLRELQEKAKPVTLSLAVTCFLRMTLGGMVIMAGMAVAMRLVDYIYK